MRFPLFLSMCMAVPVAAPAQEVCAAKPDLCAQAAALAQGLSDDLPQDLTVRGQIWRATAKDDQLILSARAFHLILFSDVHAAVTSFVCASARIMEFSDKGGVVLLDLPKAPIDIIFEPSRCEAN